MRISSWRRDLPSAPEPVSTQAFGWADEPNSEVVHSPARTNPRHDFTRHQVEKRQQAEAQAMNPFANWGASEAPELQQMAELDLDKQKILDDLDISVREAARKLGVSKSAVGRYRQAHGQAG
jgi:hypothetical protein